MKIKISDIKVGENRREIDESTVINLVKSIRDTGRGVKGEGLINPISINKSKRLIAGAHRLEACRRLGWDEIECTIMDIDGLRGELAEIDENLIRHNLNHIDEGEQLLRKKEIYEILYPETKQTNQGGAFRGNQHKKVVTAPVSVTTRTSDAGAVAQQKSFVEDTAEKMKIAPRTIRRKIQVAKNLTPEVKAIVKGRNIGERASEKLARIKEPEKQKKAAEKLAAGEPIEEPNSPKLSEKESNRMLKGIIAQLKRGPEDATIPASAFMQEYEAFAEETIRSITGYGREQYTAIYPSLSDSQRQKIKALNTDMLKAIRKINELQKGN